MHLGLVRVITTGAKLWDWIVALSWTFLPLLLCFFAAYRMAQHAGLPHPWLAFLPLVGHFYIMGKLAEPSGFHRTGRNRWPSLWYPFWSTILILCLAEMRLEAWLNGFCVTGILTGILLFSWAATAVLNAYVLYSVLWDRLRRREIGRAHV